MTRDSRPATQSACRTPLDGLRAPPGDGEVLVLPRADALRRLIDDNRRLCASWGIDLLGSAEPLAGTARHEPPIVLTGHQPGFLHPGVWAKNVVAARLARAAGGRADFLIVDSDAIHGVALRWPIEHGGRLGVNSIELPASAGATFEQLPDRTPAEWAVLFERIPASLRSDAGRGLAAFLSAFVDAAGGYVPRWSAGIRAVEQRLGIESPRFRPVSRLADDTCGGTWTRFVAHALLNARRLAAEYNAALADFGRDRGVRGRQQPVPDLAIDSDAVELPLWLWRGAGPRERLRVAEGPSGALRVFAGETRVVDVPPDDLRRDPAAALAAAFGDWRVRPRALLLTAFSRLFCCDLFIHGIGGAKYDQITDAFIRRFFGIEPPAFACVTATLRLPLPRLDADERQLAAAQRALRDVLFNPQRYLPSDAIDHAAEFLAERRKAIETAEALRRDDRMNRPARRRAWQRIREANAALRPLAPSGAELVREVERIAAALEHNRLAASRDWFFALHPLARLKQLCGALPAVGDF